MSYNSKYSGEQVENLLDQVASGNTGGGGGVIPDMSQYITEDELDTALQGKQDVIDDIETIRSGAEKGATALQSVPSEYVTETELTNKGYATTTALNNKVDKVDGKQLSTEDFTSTLKNKLEGLSNYDDTTINNAISSLQSQINTLVSGNASTAIESFNEIIAFLNGVTDSQSLDSIIASIEQQIAGKMDNVTLATVATSGSYNDLSNKPTIPSAVTESTVSGWGFTKNTGTYSKPSTGIPKTDLASAVQTSLRKADTALQSYTEQYKGTVTKVKINGSEKTPDANGVVDLGTIEGGSSGGGKDIVKCTLSGLGEIVFNEYYTAFEPNKIYYADILVFGVNVSLVTPPVGDIGEYLLYFTNADEYSIFEFPSDWLWANGIPEIEAGVSYELSVVATKVGGEYIYKAVLTPFKSL